MSILVVNHSHDVLIEARADFADSQHYAAVKVANEILLIGGSDFNERLMTLSKSISMEGY